MLFLSYCEYMYMHKITFPMLSVFKHTVRCTEHTHSIVQPSLRNLPKLSPSPFNITGWSPARSQEPAVLL